MQQVVGTIIRRTRESLSRYRYSIVRGVREDMPRSGHGYKSENMVIRFLPHLCVMWNPVTKLYSYVYSWFLKYTVPGIDE